MRPRQKLVHFLRLDTRAPLCGDAGEEPTPTAAVNGVSVCATCAKRMAEQVARAQPPIPLPPPR